MTSRNFTGLLELERALAELGDVLESRGHSYELFVIGGAAFLIQEPDRSHATGDLDIALQLIDGERHSPAPLPAPLAEAANDVRRTLQLEPGWLNSAVAAALGDVVPDGAVERAKVLRFGGLTLLVADRTDLLKLKFRAAMRRGPKGDRHRADIVAAGVTEAELESSADWYREQVVDPIAHEDRIATVIHQIRGDLHGA